MPPIQSDIIIVVSALASAISHRLRDANLPAWANASIAGLAFIVILLATFWLQGPIAVSPREIAFQIISLGIMLATSCKELYDLLGYLRDARSPLAPSSPVSQLRATAAGPVRVRDTEE